MSQDTKVLCEFFRWILKELRDRLTPAEFQALIDKSVTKGSQSHPATSKNNRRTAVR